MFKMNDELKKVVGRVKEVHGQLQSILKDKDRVVDEAKRYADRQGKEVKKLVSGDMKLVKQFIEREREELARFQKEIPGEVEKFKKFFAGQRKELEKLLFTVTKTETASGKKTRSAKSRKKR